VLLVLDASEPLTEEDLQLLEQTTARPRIVVANKMDVAVRLKPDSTYDLDCAPYVVSAFRRTVDRDIGVSAQTGEGIDELRDAIVSALTGRESLRDTAAVSNTRHIALLTSARAHLDAAHRAALAAGTPEEFLLTDLQAARAHLDEVVGTRTSEDLLEHIFANFCIGK
jgi:tRNA modification GTPase